MNFDFSNEEAIFIYGRFRRQLHDVLEHKKLPPNKRLFDMKTINDEIELCSAVVEKMEKAWPYLSSLNLYKDDHT